MRNTLRKGVLIFWSIFFFPHTPMAQQDQQRHIMVIEGQSGEASVVEIEGRAYVDVAGLTQIAHGSLSFKADRIVLSLPLSNAGTPRTEPPAEPAHSPVGSSGLSRNFMRAGIEEIATMRAWASTLAYAIQNGLPITEQWVTSSREQAAHDLRLAAVAVSTEPDRNALQLLTHEFEAVREWSNKLLQERKSMDTAKYAISTNALQDDPMSQKIISCGHFLATMLGSGSFEDDPSCH